MKCTNSDCAQHDQHVRVAFDHRTGFVNYPDAIKVFDGVKPFCPACKVALMDVMDDPIYAQQVEAENARLREENRHTSYVVAYRDGAWVRTHKKTWFKNRDGEIDFVQEALQ